MVYTVGLAPRGLPACPSDGLTGHATMFLPSPLSLWVWFIACTLLVHQRGRTVRCKTAHPRGPAAISSHRTSCRALLIVYNAPPTTSGRWGVTAVMMSQQCHSGGHDALHIPVEISTGPTDGRRDSPRAPLLQLSTAQASLNKAKWPFLRSGLALHWALHPLPRVGHQRITERIHPLVLHGGISTALSQEAQREAGMLQPTKPPQCQVAPLRTWHGAALGQRAQEWAWAIRAQTIPGGPAPEAVSVGSLVGGLAEASIQSTARWGAPAPQAGSGGAGLTWQGWRGDQRRVGWKEVVGDREAVLASRQRAITVVVTTAGRTPLRVGPRRRRAVGVAPRTQSPADPTPRRHSILSSPGNLNVHSSHVSTRAGLLAGTPGRVLGAMFPASSLLLSCDPQSTHPELESQKGSQMQRWLLSSSKRHLSSPRIAPRFPLHREGPSPQGCGAPCTPSSTRLRQMRMALYRASSCSARWMPQTRALSVSVSGCLATGSRGGSEASMSGLPHKMAHSTTPS